MPVRVDMFRSLAGDGPRRDARDRQTFSVITLMVRRHTVTTRRVLAQLKTGFLLTAPRWGQRGARGVAKVNPRLARTRCG